MAYSEILSQTSLVGLRKSTKPLIQNRKPIECGTRPTKYRGFRSQSFRNKFHFRATVTRRDKFSGSEATAVLWAGPLAYSPAVH
jgi:hypothetical protein